VIDEAPLPARLDATPDLWFACNALERDGSKLNRHRALDLWWSMIFSENRYPLFRMML